MLLQKYLLVDCKNVSIIVINQLVLKIHINKTKSHLKNENIFFSYDHYGKEPDILFC